jgi:hypothetical protein
MKTIPASFEKYYMEIQKSYFTGLMMNCEIKCDKCGIENECSILGFTLTALKEKIALRALLEETNAD